KQFTVQQDRCAMKVSTDACIQGAWTPIAGDARYVLDIGAGTGLLSLMLAQRNSDIFIDAIELDKQAAQQAQENFSASPWATRMNAICGDIKGHPFSRKYDMVICNPPFFQNSLLGNNEERNNARHTITLSYNDLLIALDNVLDEKGFASVLLPPTEQEAWAYLLRQSGWRIHRRLFIKPKADSVPNRVVTICSKTMPEEVIDEQLVIYASQNEYTPGAADLLKPFYLKL
ncbi:MAG: methyltransferase, partial [Flavipsychrobacter sp.]|nr:methyltransferase [Flavipsychrobacter sp.]